jgi:hypothetical protein
MSSSRIAISLALVGLLTFISVPSALAQAAGSADAKAAKRVNPKWKAPRNALGQPDLEGTWTSDDMRGVPVSRQQTYGTRQYMTDQEFAAREKQRATARTVDDARSGTFRNEEGTRSFSYTSMVIDPPDGRIPAQVPGARRGGRGGGGTFGVGPWEKVQDFSLYDRCITRGAVGSIMPAVYGNGLRIVQGPDSVAITYEMVHDTRVIPLDRRAPLNTDLQFFMGDSRGHYEGDTLVIESQNFTNRTSVGGGPHSEKLRMTERFTRIDPEMVDYEIRIDDPAVYTKPWTMRMTLTTQPDYEVYEYACHEGNNAMRNVLSAERAYEKAAEEAKAKGLPPPERVFQQVNGADRAR